MKVSEAGFTKAPWKFNAYDGSITDCTKSENEIATAQLEDWHNLGMGYSNANLIAAAPEMYELLDEVSHVLGHELSPTNKAYIKAIKELLAKARGES